MAKDANTQDLTTTTTEPDELETLIAGLDTETMPEEFRRVIELAVEKNKNLAEQVAKKNADRKPREAKSLVERLNAAREGEPKGLNLAAVQLANEGDLSEEILDSYFELLSATPGVTVDRSKLQMHDCDMQWHIRLYNAEQARALLPEKEAKEVLVAKTDEDNGDDE